MIPPAATALIRATLDDAQRDGVRDPDATAQRVTTALTQAGWHIAPAPLATAAQRAA